MREWLVAEDRRARIVVEPDARSTYEKRSHCADLIAGQGVRRVTLVTERYHILRSRLLLAGACGASPARRGANQCSTG